MSLLELLPLPVKGVNCRCNELRLLRLSTKHLIFPIRYLVPRGQTCKMAYQLSGTVWWGRGLPWAHRGPAELLDLGKLPAPSTHTSPSSYPRGILTDGLDWLFTVPWCFHYASLFPVFHCWASLPSAFTHSDRPSCWGSGGRGGCVSARMHSTFTTNPIAFSIIHLSGCVVRVCAMKLVSCGLVSRQNNTYCLFCFEAAGQGCLKLGAGRDHCCSVDNFIALQMSEWLSFCDYQH